MKKAIALLLVLVTLLSLTACAGKEDAASSALDQIKQKTAYEIDHCDWSSDVCSSDLSLL